MMEFHEFANHLPLMSDGEIEALAADIRQNGLNDSIWTFEGKVLDGRNRMRACLLVPVQPTFREFTGTRLQALRFVRSENVPRRHLTPSQGAVVAVEFETAETELMAAEQVAADDRKAQAKGKPRGEKKASVSQLFDTETDRNSGRVDAKLAAAHGTNRQYVADVRKIAAVKPAALAEIHAGTKTVPQVKKEIAREAMVTKLEAIETKQAKALEGVYDVLVIDPPWPMEKIERDCRPNQVAMDYPTMTEEQMRGLALPLAGDCHVWVWTTHRFLPMAFRLLDCWSLKYCCTFTWHKPGGFQPVGLPQFNCEFALYARRGAPQFIDTKAFNVCFEAPRGKHSEKPEEFYDIVRRVTAGRRVDMFARSKHEGFEAWGNEV